MTLADKINTPDTYRPKVLFIDKGNDARSLLAEGILNYAGRGRFEVFSAGAEEIKQPHSFALDLLDAYCFESKGMRSKGLDEVRHMAFDFVIQLCELAMPLTAHWPAPCIFTYWELRDPVAQAGTEEELRKAFAVTFSELGRRLYIFANIPFATLSAAQLQRELEALGDLSEIGK